MATTSPPLFAIVGPTATGKTRIAAELAHALGGEVISCDSQLVYRQFDIGVAKPTVEEKRGVTHHLIDVADPSEQYSAGRYVQDALPVLERLVGQNKPVILVGGTGFYLRSLLQPAHVLNIPPNEAFRSELLAHAAQNSNTPEEASQWLHRELAQKDPRRAQAIAPQDTKRVIRALEMIDALKGPIPDTPVEFSRPVTVIGLTYEQREAHIAKIEARLDAMLDCGFYDEAVSLYQRYGASPAMDTAHGYKHLVRVHQGELTLEEAKTQINIMIRQYSKRQMTWFRALPGIHWHSVDDLESKPDEVCNIVDAILSREQTERLSV